MEKQLESVLFKLEIFHESVARKGKVYTFVCDVG